MEKELMHSFSLLNPWLDDLPYEWDLLKAHGSKVTYKKNEPVFYQNEVGEDLFVIETGRVRLFLLSPNGDEKALAIMGRNGLLGECLLNNHSRYATSAVTASATTLYRFSKSIFLKYSGTEMNYVEQTLDIITQKYRLLCMQSLQLSYMKALPRICVTFIHLSIKYGEVLNEEAIRLNIQFTHQEMANLLGITRVTIAKNIKWLEENNYIRKREKYYHIFNIDSLAALANEELMPDV